MSEEVRSKKKKGKTGIERGGSGFLFIPVQCNGLIIDWVLNNRINPWDI